MASSSIVSSPTEEETGNFDSVLKRFTSCRILYATQSGRSKACARRAARILSSSSFCSTKVGGESDEKDTTRIMQVQRPLQSCDEHFASCGNNLQQWAGSLIRNEQRIISESQQQPQLRQLLLLLISTTGDGEQTDSIRTLWKQLLARSLPPTLLQGVSFALFGLGDRAYGPQFCAAARKVAVRLVQLGATLVADPGYGDDGTPGGGNLKDLDTWLEETLLPALELQMTMSLLPSDKSSSDTTTADTVESKLPYRVSAINSQQQQQQQSNDNNNKDASLELNDSYRAFFEKQRPLTAYSYKRSSSSNNNNNEPLLLTAQRTENRRLTADDWQQDTRHLRLQVQAQPQQITNLPYRAGDVVSILPVNRADEVDRFLSVLPERLRDMADHELGITFAANNESKDYSSNTWLASLVSYPHWPTRCTLRGWLTYCADIHALPEREDLWALSHCCSRGNGTTDGSGTASSAQQQCEKLQQLSQSSGSALYTDYILREKRTWADVLYDFDSLRAPGSLLESPAVLLGLLSPIRPREFSIASSPSQEQRLTTDSSSNSFGLDLCVAVVEGTTPLGRKYYGLCSDYLCRQTCMKTPIHCWIRPGSFHQLPVTLSESFPGRFQEPILCIGAGTGIAPLRSLILERHFYRELNQQDAVVQDASGDIGNNSAGDSDNNVWDKDDILLFGCRKKAEDFYYQSEWEAIPQLGLLTAFSQDQWHKIYVQQVLKASDPTGERLTKHLVEKGGAIYIAGGAKMAKSVKEELQERLEQQLGADAAKRFLTKLQRKGLFRVEAWS